MFIMVLCSAKNNDHDDHDGGAVVMIFLSLLFYN